MMFLKISTIPLSLESSLILYYSGKKDVTFRLHARLRSAWSTVFSSIFLNCLFFMTWFDFSLGKGRAESSGHNTSKSSGLEVPLLKLFQFLVH